MGGVGVGEEEEVVEAKYNKDNYVHCQDNTYSLSNTGNK